jgi:hypothetical protein
VVLLLTAPTGGHAPVAVLLLPPGHGAAGSEGGKTVGLALEMFDLEELSWMESVVGVVFCA